MPSLSVTDHPAIQAARDAIAEVRKAGAAYALAIAGEAALLQEKPVRKQAAIGRLMAGENPLIPGKPFTCTAAEAVVETDPRYHDFCRQITEATCGRELARTETIAVRLEAQLALAMVLDTEEL